MIYIFLFLILLIIDQYSKFIVDRTLSVGETIPIIDNFFNLTYVQNRGVAFGLFQGKIDIVSILAIIAIGLILFYFFKNFKKISFLERIAYTMIFSGAVGNMIVSGENVRIPCRVPIHKSPFKVRRALPSSSSTFRKPSYLS